MKIRFKSYKNNIFLLVSGLVYHQKTFQNRMRNILQYVWASRALKSQKITRWIYKSFT